MSEQKLLFLGTPEDASFLPMLKGMVGSCTVHVYTGAIVTAAEIVIECKQKGITGVLSTSVPLLKKLLAREHEVKNPSLDNYAGSYFLFQGIEFVFLNPLSHLVKVSYGKFLTRRYISKLTAPESWRSVPAFNWDMLTPTNADSIFQKYQSAFAISVDIETFKEPLSIRCIGYTAIFIDSSGAITTHSCVLPLDSIYALAIMRRFNWELKAPKILQNGKYDISYLSMYNAVLYNYLWDTANMFHCWYSELPKDLSSLASFFIRKSMYWKDLAETNDLQEYYRYNALDTYSTALVFMAWMLEAPAWARKNYIKEFPLVFPCHLSEMTGIARDMEAMKVAKEVVTGEIAALSKSLEIVTATPNFNSNSPKQVKQLLGVLGIKEADSSDEAALKKYSSLHPINGKILGKILELRKKRKLSSTYLRTDADITATSKGGAKEYRGRILYALNPHGTDTSRLASKEHHFWTGLQIQNITRGKTVKSTFVADEGFLFGESDLEQAESRDTAYIAGEESLIKAVTGTRDFHSVNASCFFGVPYDQIFDDATRKQLDVALRDLAKRVNHGANYNMGPAVLVETMGEDKVWAAAKLLSLPRFWTLRQIAEHLLGVFHKTYPGIKHTYYPKVIQDVVTTRMLVGATGWTRYCFGNPDKNKSDLNAYVAHPPQSLNAQVLNAAYMDVFYKVAINPEHAANFKLCAQIHDSILFQYRIGHDYLAQLVKKCMEREVTVKGADGKVRNFTVPAAVKMGGKHWSECK